MVRLVGSRLDTLAARACACAAASASREARLAAWAVTTASRPSRILARVSAATSRSRSMEPSAESISARCSQFSMALAGKTSAGSDGNPLGPRIPGETGGVNGEREAASLATADDGITSAEGVSSGDSRMADPALIATMTATSMSRKAKAKDGRLIPAATSARPAAAADRRWKVSERMAASRPRASSAMFGAKRCPNSGRSGHRHRASSGNLLEHLAHLGPEIASNRARNSSSNAKRRGLLRSFKLGREQTRGLRTQDTVTPRQATHTRGLTKGLTCVARQAGRGADAGGQNGSHTRLSGGNSANQH